MNTASRWLAMAGLLLGCVHAVSAQTADEVVEKHLTALGGRAALGKVTSRTITGEVSLSTPGGEIAGPIEIMAEAPNKSRTLIKLDLSSFGVGQMVFDQRFDGTSGYVLDSLQGNRDITGSQLEFMKSSAFPSPFLNYKEVGATVELGAKEQVGGRQAFVLIFRPKSGPPVRQYIDAESYLAVRQVVKLDIPPVGELEQTTDLLDYRDVDGLKVPFQLNSTNPVQTTRIKVNTVQHNGKIDEALFSK